MKVLERGPGWGIKLRCTGSGNGGGGCESLLLVEENDIYVTANTDYTGDTDYYYTFRCPICQHETDIKSSDVPSSIKSKAMNLYRSIHR